MDCTRYKVVSSLNIHYKPSGYSKTASVTQNYRNDN